MEYKPIKDFRMNIHSCHSLNLERHHIVLHNIFGMFLYIVPKRVYEIGKEEKGIS
jgi:hypothetical protein